MKNKKNFLFALIGAGTLVLSAGVGFAAWTINVKNSEKGSGDISVSADGTVIDNRIHLGTCQFQKKFNSISFGAVENGEITAPWLSANPLNDSEKLTLKFDVSVTGGIGLNVVVDASITDEGTDKKFNSLIDNGIIGKLPTIAQTELQDPSKNGTYTGTITATFTWGSLFTSTKTKTIVNPYTYFNEQTYTPDLGKLAKENIEKLKGISNYNGLKLNYTVSVK